MAQAQFKRSRRPEADADPQAQADSRQCDPPDSSEAGVEVAGCEINPRDGTIIVVTGKPVGSDIDMDDTASPDPKWN